MPQATSAGGHVLAEMDIQAIHLRLDSREDLSVSECFRLLFVIRSDSMLSLGGRLYSLDTGSVLILPPGAGASLVYGTHCEYTEISVLTAAEDPLQMKAQLERLARGLSHIRLSAAKTEAFQATLIRLSELRATGRDRGRAAYARLYDLIADLVSETRQAIGPAVFETKGSSRLVREIKAYLDLHFTRHITLGDLANRFYVSPSHLCRVFKEETGRRPFAYINDLRIERAVSLLKAGQRSGSTGDACGYRTDQHFIKEFRARMGTTPGRFRISFLKNKEL